MATGKEGDIAKHPSNLPSSTMHQLILLSVSFKP